MLASPKEIMELGRDDASGSASRNDVSSVPEESSANIHPSSVAVDTSLVSGNRREFLLHGESGGDASK
jgi:hypothetical protein